MQRVLEFIKEWGDYLFIGAGVFGYFFIIKHIFWPTPNEILSQPELIQFSIFLATLLTLFYAVIIKDRPQRYRNRPKIQVNFNSNEADFFHSTIINDSAPVLDGKWVSASIPAYFVRLRIQNVGKRTLKNVEVILEKVEAEQPLSRPFLPLNLAWSFGDLRGQGGQWQTRIPQGMFRTLDLIEFRQRLLVKEFVNHLTGSPDYDRYKELGNGFRTCTLKPNTLSDTYPDGGYKFYISVSADNAELWFIKISVFCDGEWSNNSSTMRRSHLKVKLVKQGREKSEIFH